MTKIEGTLIDIAVRPACSGGVFQALEACKRAKDRASIGTLFATLRSLDDAYSYRQAIRFCLERAGYSATQYERLGDLGLDCDFYRAHDLREMPGGPLWPFHGPFWVTNGIMRGASGPRIILQSM